MPNTGASISNLRKLWLSQDRKNAPISNSLALAILQGLPKLAVFGVWEVGPTYNLGQFIGNRISVKQTFDFHHYLWQTLEDCQR
jgi:hypothetical protein